MIDLYYWPTPNGHKISIFLEESGLKYKIYPVDITKGEQFKEDFLRLSPNNKMPAIIDHDPRNTTGPVALFESGAILLYLADKLGSFISDETQERSEILQWLFWQVGGLGPMVGQNFHFQKHASEKLPYAIERYKNETGRLFKVLDKQLAHREFIAGMYSVADIAVYPWIEPYQALDIDLKSYPHIKNWFDAIAKRPAVIRAYAIPENLPKS